MPGTRKLGRTSSHRMAMLRAMVTFLLENGRIAYDGDADGCLSSGVLERVFGVEKQIFHKNDRRYVFFSDDPSARSRNPD